MSRLNIGAARRKDFDPRTDQPHAHQGRRQPECNGPVSERQSFHISKVGAWRNHPPRRKPEASQYRVPQRLGSTRLNAKAMLFMQNIA